MEWATRTMVPIIAGTLITFGAKFGINLDNPALVIILTGIVTGAYVSLARWVEKMWPGSFVAKFLMSFGLASKQPAYVPPASVEYTNRLNG
jgi:hypothetical protein